MAPSVATRSQKLNKAQGAIKKDKSFITSKKNSPSSPANCSIIDVKRHDSSSEYIHDDRKIISDLRNKLATTEFALNDLDAKYKSLQDEISKLQQLNELYLTQIEQHKDTIKILTKEITDKTFTNRSTQTDELPINASNICQSIQVETETPARHDDNSNEEDINKNNILLLADSHGRGLFSLLKKRLSNFNILSIFKPNAPFGNVVTDVNLLSKNFTKKDYILIIGGSNNYYKQSAKLINEYKKVIDNCNHTNVIFCTIPFNYCKNSTVNNAIQFINSSLLKLNTQSTNSKFIDINLYLGRNAFTKHGLHLNTKGKNILCDIFKQNIEKSPLLDKNYLSKITKHNTDHLSSCGNFL